MDEKTQKAHIKKKGGKKVERKKENKFSNAKKSSNPKAFTFNSAGKAEKNVRRNNDLGEKKLHVPMVDRTPIESPPVVIAVVGPPGVSFFFSFVLIKKITFFFSYRCRLVNQHLFVL